MREAGLELRRDWVIEEPFSIEGGKMAVRQLAAQAERPTALICNTDLQAIGALHESRNSGIRVPEDMSVTGMDDIELGALMVPTLTTIRVPSKEIGVLAARRIVGMIEKRNFNDNTALKCELVLRDSLGDAPATETTRARRHARR
jgi:LacI family transcriptional regulator